MKCDVFSALDLDWEVTSRFAALMLQVPGVVSR
jgi:hypothetical protein